jgi:AcrR family transcriptional regulator
LYKLVFVKTKSNSVRREPTQTRSRQTVEALLGAVVRVLKREGPDAVTTNRIAEVAGVSIGSVYQYFPDKRAIFLALHERHIQEIDGLIEATLVKNATAPLDQFARAIVEAMVAAHTNDPELYQELYKQVPHQADGTQDFAVRLHKTFRLALASRAKELPSGRDLDKVAFIVAHMVDSLSHGAVLRRPSGLSLTAAKDEAVRAILAYLHS